MTRPDPTGAERLRAVVKTMDATPESFLDAFSPAEIIAIFEAHFAASWDYCPSTWEPRQIREAIRGTTPRWNATGTEAEYATEEEQTSTAPTSADLDATIDGLATLIIASPSVEHAAKLAVSLDALIKYRSDRAQNGARK